MSGQYRRVLLKLSGEFLSGPKEAGIDPETLSRVAGEIARVHDMSVQLGVVIGGGNLYRGLRGVAEGMDRVTADQMGMLATIINALALQDMLERRDVPTRVMTAVPLEGAAERFVRRRAIRHLEKDRVLLLAGGTGNPFFTTDTAAALRGAELGADVLLKATRVDGVFSADPEKDPGAEFIRTIGYKDVIGRGLGVMDSTAVALCMENRIPIVVFNMKEDNLVRVIRGEEVGTTVKEAI
ncbi:MAG: UMP kinase [Candidatus Eisenbacteria bacterium]|nr:UMP kinase [Candidatus Eisenbacteria bacterium]